MFMLNKMLDEMLYFGEISYAMKNGSHMKK